MEIFHVLNRGVEKRAIVLDDSDRLRFIHDLFAFNDSDLAPNYLQPGRHTGHSRDVLVHLYAYCLMGNHYHLLLSPAVENGVSLFMHKLNMGYAKYFNDRYARTGVLWQGVYKRIRIEHDAHMFYIPFYIHLNPLDFTNPEWRTGDVKNVRQALVRLKQYRWSSHLDYSGVSNFPSLLEKNLLADLFGSPARYERELGEIMSSLDIAKKSIVIEER